MLPIKIVTLRTVLRSVTSALEIRTAMVGTLRRLQKTKKDRPEDDVGARLP
jgi:hypothetical protein